MSMPLRDGALDTYLSDLRAQAKLSLAQVCERTKIQARFVEALEAGRYGEVPSNTHLRAFSLALAQACRGDAELTTLLVRRVLAASAPAGDAPRSFDTPAPAPIVVKQAPAPARPVTERQPEGPAPRLAAEGPTLAVAAEEGPARGLAAASARLRSLPLTALLGLLAVAGALSYGASVGLERWKARSAARAAVEAADGIDPISGKAVDPAPAKGDGMKAAATEPAGAAAAVSAPADAAPAPVPGELILRARRDCWLVLDIDGKRLPTVTLHDGDKLRWPVENRAKLLAGNVGALRVWWRGDNLGYLGELGVRANALVFERGKAPRYDKDSALPLPAGVPE